MVSVIFRTPDTLAARPIPGKIYMLLHCDGTSVLLLDNVTGAKGLPVATYESNTSNIKVTKSNDIIVSTHNSATISSFVSFLGCTFALGSRIGHRHDDGVFIHLAHILKYVRIEDAGLSAETKKHGWFKFLDCVSNAHAIGDIRIGPLALIVLEMAFIIWITVFAILTTYIVKYGRVKGRA
jgi:hypothetical protein